MTIEEIINVIVKFIKGEVTKKPQKIGWFTFVMSWAWYLVSSHQFLFLIIGILTGLFLYL